jgi:predicted dehydrogenase
MERLFRAGIVGCGFIASFKHLPALAKLKHRIAIVCFCDIVIERAQEACKSYGAQGAHVCTDYRELIAQDLDIVYVLTPNDMHCEITVAALTAGKDVLCEKPMAINSEQGQRMLEASQKTGKRLYIGYQYRWQLDSLYMHRVAQSGDLGEIYMAQANAVRRRGIPTWGVFLDKQRQGGGSLIDIGTHALDMTLWMMNNYKPHMVMGKVYKKLGTGSTDGNSFGTWNPERFDVDDSAFANIIMEDGATIFLRVSWALNCLDTREQQITLCGTKGGADMDDGVRVNGVRNGALFTSTPELFAGGTPADEQGITPADREARSWLDTLEFGTEQMVLPQQALTVTRILEAIYRSSETGRAICLSDKR